LINLNVKKLVENEKLILSAQIRPTLLRIGIRII
jgi:hypothetical protein